MIRHRPLGHILIMLSLVALSSCNKNTNPVGPSYVSGEYWPFAIGNKWQYIHHQTDTLGNITGAETTISMEVIGTSVLGGRNAWQLMLINQQAGSKPDSMPGFLSYADNGDLMSYDDKAPHWHVVTPFSCLRTGVRFSKIDTTVSVNTFGSGGNITYDTTLHFDITAFDLPVQRTVTVPAGTFQTQDFVEIDSTVSRHHSSSGTADTSMWGGRTHLHSALNVGMVKILEEPSWSSYSGTEGKSGGYVEELVSYTVH
jgi:hypothetical protein